MKEINNQSEIILYQTENGQIKVDTVFQNGTIWLSQAQMGELFDVGRPAITKHLTVKAMRKHFRPDEIKKDYERLE